MFLAEMFFTDWYHKYVTIEVDDLTDTLKDQITVHNDDCYALCSSYCDENGFVLFNVLSIGSTWENCTRGLKNKKMLGTFEIDQVIQFEARLVDPDHQMMQKNEPFLKEMDQNVDEDLLKTRLDTRLDLLRDPFYPDVVMTSIIKDASFREYAMRIIGTEGPFLKGVILEQPAKEFGVEEDDPIYALLYVAENEYRLFGLFVGNDLDKDERDAMNQIIMETSQLGIDFNGLSIKS